jgi:putative salt-induced outer membrane protein YdiY
MLCAVAAPAFAAPLTTTTSPAQDANEEPRQGAIWRTAAELGAISTSGNTAGTSITGKLDVRAEHDAWTNQMIVSGFFKEDERRAADSSTSKVKTAQRLALTLRTAYRLDEDRGDGDRVFALLSHVDDRFGPYAELSTFNIGHSSRWYETSDKSVDVELGPGYSSATRSNGVTESGLTVRGAAALRWQLSPMAAFTQNLSVERSTSNVFSVAESALSTKINNTMQMKAAFIARNNSNVPADKRNLDTQTSVTLVYSF